MELSLEKGVKVVVEVDGSTFINSFEGKLYQRIEDDRAFLMVKSTKGDKEIKIQIVKDANS